MTSTIDPPTVSRTERFGSHIHFATEADKVLRFPEGSRQRMIGDLWLAWLAHIRLCQKAAILVPGCPRNYTLSYALELAYPNWYCCSEHRGLLRLRKELTESAQRLPVHPAPHQSDEVLTQRWWFERGYHYVVGLPVITPDME